MPEDRCVCTLEVETDGKTRTVTLEDRVVSFGRSRKNSVPLRDDGKVSSQHCQVVRQKDAWMLIDCGSKNKTFLNGTPVSVAALRNGDKFRIGSTTVSFREGEPRAMEPKDAEKLLKRESANEAAGQAIAAALSAPKRESRLVDPAPRSDRPRPSGEAVRIERGSPGVSIFAFACFFVAGALSGLTALFVLDTRADKVKPPVAKTQQEFRPAAGDGAVAPPADVVVAQDPPKEVPVVAPPAVEPPKEEPVAVVPPVEPPKEEPVVAKPPVEPPKPEPPKEEPVVARKPPPPAASDDPPTGEPTDVGARPPADPRGETPAAEKRPPAQFMGLTTTLKYVIYMLDVTGSMEDPASVAPSEFMGPPEVRLSAELSRQLEKFARKDVKTKLDAAKYELTHSIAYLHPDTEFTVVFYSFQPTPWQKKFMPASDKNKIDAIKRIKTTSAWGGTNIYDAIETAFTVIDDQAKTVKKPADTADRKASYAIFLVTDGKHNTGRFMDPEEFLSQVRKLNADGRAALSTIGVGEPGKGVDAPDRVFLTRLAEENGGENRMLK